MKSRKIGMMAVVAGFALGAADGAQAATVRTVAGRAYEGEHLALDDSSVPLYKLSVTTERGPGVDRMQVVDFDASAAYKRRTKRGRAGRSIMSLRISRSSSATRIRARLALAGGQYWAMQ